MTEERMISGGKIDKHVALFSVTLFLSAFLMFTVQPMAGKMLLPLVGGSPSGWLVAMSFFQIALLAGYWLAHKLSRLSVQWHVWTVCVFALAGLWALPFEISEYAPSGEKMPEALSVFWTLTAKLLLPFLALSMLSPSMQRAFAASSSPQAKNPYFLFAASNLGSFGGLFAYPLFFEFLFGLKFQTELWRFGFAALAVLCFFCLVFSRKASESKSPAKDAAPVAWKKRGQWALLAFIPSSLMMGVTAHITTEVGGVPFFWVLPLAAYLLTFVAAFSREKPYKLSLDMLACIATAVFVFTFLANPMSAGGGNFFQMALPFAVFVIMALQCHLSLSLSRPGTENLTEFYLWISVGGALGGVFNVYVAPFLLPLPMEFMLVALLGCWTQSKWAELFGKKTEKIAYAGMAVALASIIGLGYFRNEATPFALFLFLLIAGIFAAAFRPRAFAVSAPFLCLAALFFVGGSELLHVGRNFFGVVKVYDVPYTRFDEKAPTEKFNDKLRMLYHGATVHGVQNMNPAAKIAPNVYFHSKGPLGDAMAMRDWRDVGIIGMGAGNMVCYESTGRKFTYYEIDPQIPDVAKEWFGFMRSCGMPEIKIGDGRKLLENTSATHDMLIIDAFTSDAIPVHLLTKEAFAIYLNRLTEDGAIMAHISNRYFDLRGQFSSLSKELGLAAMVKSFVPSKEEKSDTATPSLWVALARSEKTLEQLRGKGWTALPPPDARLWTDDYSNLLSAFGAAQ